MGQSCQNLRVRTTISTACQFYRLTCLTFFHFVRKYTRYITGLFSQEALVLTGILPASKPAQKLKILDTATGPGTLPLQIAGAYTEDGLAEDVEIVATDFSKGMIEILERRIGERGYGKVIKAEVMDAQVRAECCIVWLSVELNSFFCWSN